MKSIVIRPREKFCDDLEEVRVLGFKEGDSYFILQRVDKNSENFHIELNDQSKGCYNGIESVIIEENRIIFKLNRVGQDIIDTEMIEIVDNEIANSDYEKIKREIQIISTCLRNSKSPH